MLCLLLSPMYTHYNDTKTRLKTTLIHLTARVELENTLRKVVLFKFLEISFVYSILGVELFHTCTRKHHDANTSYWYQSEAQNLHFPSLPAVLILSDSTYEGV